MKPNTYKPAPARQLIMAPIGAQEYHAIRAELVTLSYKTSSFAKALWGLEEAVAKKYRLVNAAILRMADLKVVPANAVKRVMAFRQMPEGSTYLEIGLEYPGLPFVRSKFDMSLPVAKDPAKDAELELRSIEVSNERFLALLKSEKSQPVTEQPGLDSSVVKSVVFYAPKRMFRVEKMKNIRRVVASEARHGGKFWMEVEFKSGSVYDLGTVEVGKAAPAPKAEVKAPVPQPEPKVESKPKDKSSCQMEDCSALGKWLLEVKSSDAQPALIQTCDGCQGNLKKLGMVLAETTL